MKYSFILAGLLLCMPHAYAQERTASGPMNTQMTWSALSSRIDTINTRNDATNIRIEQIVACARKGMVYTSGSPGDNQGCLEASQANNTTQNITSLISTINTLTKTVSDNNVNLTKNINDTNGRVSNILTCGAQGKSFNGGGCVGGTGITSCRLVANASGGSCPGDQARIQSEGTCHTGSGGRGGYDYACTVTSCIQVICQ